MLVIVCSLLLVMLVVVYSLVLVMSMVILQLGVGDVDGCL